MLVYELIEALNALEDAEDLEVVYPAREGYNLVNELRTVRLNGRKHRMPVDSVELS